MPEWFSDGRKLLAAAIILAIGIAAWMFRYESAGPADFTTAIDLQGLVALTFVNAGLAAIRPPQLAASSLFTSASIPLLLAEHSPPVLLAHFVENAGPREFHRPKGRVRRLTAAAFSHGRRCSPERMAVRQRSRISHGADRNSRSTGRISDSTGSLQSRATVP
jgi:hypothetical protein